MTDNAPVLIERPSDHTALVTLNRPDTRNAYNEALLTDLVDTLVDLDEDEIVRSIVLTGAGKTFCAGADLKEMPLTPEMDFHEYETGLKLFQNVVRTLRSITTPVIAAINGYALGAGCDTALACDFRIVSQNATIGETFIDVGFVPGDGGAYLLPRLIGESRAKELIFTGQKLEGSEIVDWGLAREQVDNENLIETALTFAETLADRPPIALGENKALVNGSFDSNLETALQNATRAQRICSQTHDHSEAIEAFRENREPEFEGK